MTEQHQGAGVKLSYAVAEALHADLVISRRRRPELTATMDRMVRTGRLVPVLPGVYAAPETAGDLPTRLAAVAAWDRDAVLTGRVAAQQTFWPRLRVRNIEVACPGREPSAPGFSFQQRRIRPDHVLERGDLRLTTPALTALDLTDEFGGDPIDKLLYSRQASLADLYDVLAQTPYRSGNIERRRLLVESRDEPWSHPERVAHRALRAAGITGWQANHRVELPGVRYFIDIAFEAQRLAIEIDSPQYHGDATFERDRWRQNDIVFDGWHVLRFTAELVVERTHIFIAQIREALRRWKSGSSMSA